MDQQEQVTKYEHSTWYWAQWTSFFEAALTGTANSINSLLTVNQATAIAFQAMQKLIDLRKL